MDPDNGQKTVSGATIHVCVMFLPQLHQDWGDSIKIMSVTYSAHACPRFCVPTGLRA